MSNQPLTIAQRKQMLFAPKNNSGSKTFNGSAFPSISNRRAMFGPKKNNAPKKNNGPKANNAVKKYNNNRSTIPNRIVANRIRNYPGNGKKNNAPVAKPPSLANRWKTSVNANMAKRNNNAQKLANARYKANMQNAGLNHAVNILRSKIKPGGMANTLVRSMAKQYIRK